MYIFYTPDVSEENYLLSESESKHAMRVLRLSEGSELLLIDGEGTQYKAVITHQMGKRTAVHIISKTTQKERSEHYLHIAIAPTKSTERLEFFLEKATEIGIDEITPLLCRFSERKCIKNERLERVIIAAMKQSRKAFKPQLNPLTKFSDFVALNNQGNRYIAHCHETRREVFKHLITRASQTLIMIGPEGDFSPEEVRFAETNDFQSVRLSHERLRTETAGIVACHTVNLITEL